MNGSKAKYAQVIGGLWVLFGAVWLGICTYRLLTSPFRPEHGGTQSYLIVLAFAVVAIVSGVAQVFAKILGFFGTAFLAMLLLPYIVFYLLFVGYRSGPPGIAYCVAVAIFSMATIRCFALRLKDQKPEDSAR